jgi:hypothetical protein
VIVLNTNEQLSLYTVHHKRDILLDDFKRLFSPIHGGAAISSLDLGIQRDDEGANISDRNPNFSELTAIHWIAQQPCPDFVGLMHYRRFFVIPKPFGEVKFLVKFWRRRALYKLGLRKKAIVSWRLKAAYSRKIAVREAGLLPGFLRDRLGKYDAVVPRPARITMTTRAQYAIDHFEKDFDLFLSIMCELHPDLQPSIDRLPNFRHIYPLNMFIFRREIFLDYCDKLFSTLFEMEKRIDLSGYDPYQARVFGFLSERFMAIYIDHLKRSRPLCLLELPVMFYDGPQVEAA